MVDIQKSILSSQSSISQNLIRFCFQQRIERIVWSFNCFSSFSLENSSLSVLFDFDQFQSVLNINVLFLTFLFDELVTSFIELTESIICIDDCQSRISPTESAS